MNMIDEVNKRNTWHGKEPRFFIDPQFFLNQVSVNDSWLYHTTKETKCLFFTVTLSDMSEIFAVFWPGGPGSQLNQQICFHSDIAPRPFRTTPNKLSIWHPHTSTASLCSSFWPLPIYWQLKAHYISLLTQLQLCHRENAFDQLSWWAASWKTSLALSLWKNKDMMIKPGGHSGCWI